MYKLAILHSGAANTQSILDELYKIALAHVVRGNNDKEWVENLPETLNLILYDVHFFWFIIKRKSRRISPV